ncbi:MAG: hypothetical protein HY507_01250 [Candidatus Zambryskibacteria bacterium]|nr:hypothetical protein [Candidatus Zambryskibacteria bacterium]
MEHKTVDWKKYLLVFIITGVIFATAIAISNYFGQKKLDEIRSIQDKIAIDILSSETQFSLLEDSSCKNVSKESLSTELGSLEEKLSYTENELGVNDPQVVTLKRYYSLLEIKDYLLMNKISEKCKITPVSIIYFYSNKGDCSDCQKEGYVLTSLRETYPDLRVYSFDYNIDLSAVKTLIGINKVKNNLPAIFIKDQSYYGFQSIEDLEKAVPELQVLKTKNATTTNKK